MDIENNYPLNSSSKNASRKNSSMYKTINTGINSKVANKITNSKDTTELEVKRINDLIEAPSTIENMSVCDNYLAIGRKDNSIDIWDTNSWNNVVKIYGLKSK